MERIKLSQADDPYLKEIMDEARSGKKPEFSISKDGALKFGSRLCVPNDPLIKKGDSRGGSLFSMYNIPG